MNNQHFSWQRLYAVMLKEFIQMKRDRLTFAMLIMLPLMQLILFGYAINTNPKNLPTTIVSADYSNFTRAFIKGMENTDYFRVTRQARNIKQARRWLDQGRVSFVISFPPDFSRRFVRGQRPQILVESDATDPVATGSAMAAITTLTQTVFNPLLVGNLRALRGSPGPVNVITHALYNPENITQYNIVPGLLGVVLTMTMVIITSLAITRERERGTMEHLLATPVRPAEVMIGKITPFIIVGYIQVILILFFAHFLFHVPILGSVVLLLLMTLPFIAANLSMGLTFSSLATNQLQATQMAFFFFLPSILLSGFMFPFPGMPQWAQWLGEALPLTHFLRVVRGILLKGNGFDLVAPQLWPMILFTLIVIAIGIKRYRKTLD